MAKAKAWSGLVGMDLAKDASCRQAFTFDEGLWTWPEGYAKAGQPKYQVVVVDYGVKRNILRALTSIGAHVTVVPASTSAADILARNPDGVMLSNGPGDPAATGAYSVPEIQALVASGKPVFVYMTADWCLTCKVNEQAAIERAEVTQAFARKGIVIMVGDWTNADPAISRFLEARGRSGVPLYLFYPKGAAELQELPQVLTPAMLTGLAG